MVPMLLTTISQPDTPGTFARPVVSMVFTEPPPPDPSTRRISGRRSSLAICSHWRCLPLIVASADPPRTVKSSPPTTTGRPSTLARPKMKLDGTELLEVVLLVVGRAAGDLADFVEASRIDEQPDPLPDPVPPAFVLPLHLLRAAQLLGERFAAPELVHLPLPVHARPPLCRRSECSLEAAGRW